MCIRDRDYIKHFNADIKKGRLWNNDFEMVAGANINIDIGENISGAHGVINSGGVHDDHTYKIVGVLEPTGSVLDRLLLTSVNSVLEIHGLENIDDHNKHNHEEDKNINMHHDKHEEHSDEHHDNHKHNHDSNENYKKFEKNVSSSLEPEITALLIKTKSPVANINLPRFINRQTNMQAANPALEITRLTSMFGMGSKTLTFLSIFLISIAVLSIFSGLAGNLENRMGDLAILRALGYSKKRIFKIIAMEGTFIIFSGIFLGTLMSFFSFEILSHIVTPLHISKAKFIVNFEFYIIIASVLIAGCIASIIPAYKGSKISVANQLSQNI